jgi:hypothetical protein
MEETLHLVGYILKIYLRWTDIRKSDLLLLISRASFCNLFFFRIYFGFGFRMVKSVTEVYSCFCMSRAITAQSKEVVFFDKHTTIDNTVQYCSNMKCY